MSRANAAFSSACSPLAIAANPVGQAGSAMVEADQPAHRTELLREPHHRAQPAKLLQMRDERPDQDDVDAAAAAAAEDLVRDVNVAVPRVPDVVVGHGHARSSVD
jgi:hypothetical protein